MQIKVVIPEKKSDLEASFTKRLAKIEQAIRSRPVVKAKKVTNKSDYRIKNRLTRIERMLGSIPKQKQVSYSKELKQLRASVNRIAVNKGNSALEKSLIDRFERIVRSMVSQKKQPVIAKVDNRSLVRGLSKNFDRLEDALKNQAPRVIPSPS